MENYMNVHELDKAINEGFVNGFTFWDGLLICTDDLKRCYFPKDTLIVPKPDPMGEHIVYRITTADGLKGTVVINCKESQNDF